MTDSMLCDCWWERKKDCVGHKPRQRSLGTLMTQFFHIQQYTNILCVFGLVSLAPVRERSKHIPKSLRLERQSGFVWAYQQQSRANGSKCLPPTMTDTQHTKIHTPNIGNLRFPVPLQLHLKLQLDTDKHRLVAPSTKSTAGNQCVVYLRFMHQKLINYIFQWSC